MSHSYRNKALEKESKSLRVILIGTASKPSLKQDKR